MPTLILLRHGQSEWNATNQFTGWHDCDLTKLGEAEAREGARLLADAGILPDVVHTSLQVRAIRTAELALAELGRSWIPVRRDWRLARPIVAPEVRVALVATDGPGDVELAEQRLRPGRGRCVVSLGVAAVVIRCDCELEERSSGWRRLSCSSGRSPRCQS